MNFSEAQSTFDISMEQLFSLNRINSEIWNRILNNKKNDAFCYSGLNRIVFEKDKLKFFYAEQVVPFLSLSSHFADVVSSNSNFFNDPLPDKEYVDMKDSILVKYSILNPTKDLSLKIVKKWQAALESVHVYLGQIEQKLFSNTQLITKINALFSIQEEGYVGTATFVPKHLSCGKIEMKFEVNVITDDVLPEIAHFAETISQFYQLGEVGISGANEEIIWEIVGSNLAISDNKTKLTKTTRSGHDNSNALGSIGWGSGLHTWKLRVDGPIEGSTTKQRLYWVVVGVATEAMKQNPNQSTYHVDSQTFGHCTNGGYSYYSLGKVSGSDAQTPPSSIVTLVLDCDEGTLSFSLDTEFLKITVPAKTTLYPWAHLYTVDNSVTFLP